MQYNKKDLIEISLDKAKTALSDAKFSFINDRLYNAQNRVYYAVFYSVTALSYMFDEITSKHSHLMAWFNQKFIHEEKIFDPFFFKFYKKAFENRRKSDYVFTWKPQKAEIEADLKNAEIFINLVEKFIKDNFDINE